MLKPKYNYRNWIGEDIINASESTVLQELRLVVEDYKKYQQLDTNINPECNLSDYSINIANELLKMALEGKFDAFDWDANIEELRSRNIPGVDDLNSRSGDDMRLLFFNVGQFMIDCANAGAKKETYKEHMKEREDHIKYLQNILHVGIDM